MSPQFEPQLDGNLSHAWLRAFRQVYQSPGHEVQGLVMQLEAPEGRLLEDTQIRDALDASLERAHRASLTERTQDRRRWPTSVSTVASTIFPSSMWNSKLDRSALFERYERIYPTIMRHPSNRYGTYFGRFITGERQLQHVIATRTEHNNRRRSAYQLVAFDPAADHGDWLQRGFPCLHQVSFVPDSYAGSLSVFGYYPTQTMYEKAYGNYLGLWRLGEFVAHEWGLTMTSLTCVSVVAKSSGGKRGKAARDLLDSLEEMGVE